MTDVNPMDGSWYKSLADKILNKVDKVSGKGLSTNDYDSTAKGKVDALGTASTHAAGDFATPAQITAAINALINGAGPAVDTLGELAAIIATDETGLAALVTAMAGKVDKVTGKQLSTEDYTTTEKTKLAGLSNARTSSALTASLVTSTAGGGTRIDTAKPSTVRATVSTSTTVNVTTGAAATSGIIAEICATDSATAGDWAEMGRFENGQTCSLAIALGLAQVNKGQINFDLPAGWYYRLRSFGTGTHSEAFVSGQKTIYG